MASWSTARDAVAEALYEAFVQYAPKRRVELPAFHDLDFEVREAWSQVADRSAAILAGSFALPETLPGNANAYRDVAARGPEDAVSDADQKALERLKRRAVVRLTEANPGPRLRVCALPGYTPDDAPVVTISPVGIDPKDVDRLDFDLKRRTPANQATNPSKGVRILSLYNLFSAYDLPLEGLTIELAIEDDTVATGITDKTGEVTIKHSEAVALVGVTE